MHVDTHVLVWLFAGEAERFPEIVRERLKASAPMASPIVQLELDYLHEIGRLGFTGREIIRDLSTRVGLRISTTPFQLVVERAADLSWTRDPFDRLVVAHALSDGEQLLTRDEHLRQHCSSAVWD